MTETNVIRDQRGVVIGRLEPQRLTGKTVARDRRGRILGSFDPREGLTRDAVGRVLGRGNLLPGLILMAD
ncbi:hypothetical protein [Alsobacter sp. SYSU BS001988]